MATKKTGKATKTAVSAAAAPTSTTTKKAAKVTPKATPAKTTPQATTKAVAPKEAATPKETSRIAALLSLCPEAIEVNIAEEHGIAVRLKTEQLELPMLVHVGELVVFDLYPFRFVGVDVKKVDWVRILRLCRSGYVQLGLDQDFEDEDVVVYSFPLALKALDEAMVGTVVSTLAAFASDNYDDVMAATGLIERQPAKPRR